MAINSSNLNSHTWGKLNFDDWNYEPVDLWKGEIAWKFKRFDLQELVDRPSNVWPVPNVVFITTHSGNIYAVYESSRFVSKNQWVQNLEATKRDEIVNADLIIFNSHNKQIHPVMLADCDNVIRYWMPFHFTSKGRKNNTSNIVEIVGDSGSIWKAEWEISKVKQRLIDLVKNNN